ncbi:MAG: M1 family aminopeptidase [Phaeodactylibacter sp.]|uniref:ABC transporter permease/M1 family aminopeptidase n=1 Tax=Phaeodactylibacter sp. TaxID=1940289 RepID=UPI0032EC32A3
MLASLLQFEYVYQMRQRTMLFFSILFLGLGWLMGIKGFTPPNLFLNSPYMLAHNIALLSLSVVFPVLFFTLSGLLRDQLYQFQGILYSTAVQRSSFFWSRFFGVLSMSVLAFSMILPGMMLGVATAEVEPGRILPGQGWSYFYLWLVFIVPNGLICTVTVFAAGLLSRNRLAVYATAISIYGIYWLCAIFFNSPLMAAAQPPDPENIIWAALADPFGISAFLEQSLYWTPAEKNTHLPALSGYFLLNRCLWIGLALLLLGFSYTRFAFRPKLEKSTGKATTMATGTTPEVPTRPPIQLRARQWKSFRSIFSFELRQLLFSWPFLLIMGLWLVIVFTEIYSRINSGGPYNDSLYPTTALLVWLIEDPLPYISLLLILLYTGELLWRDREHKIAGILGSVPATNQAMFWARALTLFSLPLLLILTSVLLALGFQVAYNYSNYELQCYLAMLYYSGLPILFYTTIILLVQILMPRKYLGMATAFTVFLVTRPSLMGQLGVHHPLLQLGFFPNLMYTDMNGFGDTSRPFHHFALHWSILGIIFIFLSYQLWPRSYESSLSARWQNLQQQWRTRNTILLAGAGLLFLLSSLRIYRELHIANEYQSPQEQLDFKAAYERQYKHLQTDHYLFPRAIDQQVELYPHQGKYKVKARYTVQNKSDTVLTRLFITERLPLTRLEVQGARLLERDSTFGTWLYQLEPVLQPGDCLDYQYELSWERKGYESSKSLLENGTYLSRGEYDPVLNYRRSLEIQDPTERHQRGLPPLVEEPVLETHIDQQATIGRIDFNCTLSTVEGQTAIAPGKLIDQWKTDGRAYFHYRSTTPLLPILNYLSAHYARRDTMVNGVSMELYFHSGHAYNIAEVETYAVQALVYCEKAFGAYPHDHLRIAEIPSHWHFGGQAMPGTISMVADRLYLTDPRGSPAFDLVAKRTIHEVAHQWWGGVLSPKNTPGASLIIEGLAKYTEAAVMRQDHGWSAPWQISQTANNRYFQGRSNATDSEPPLYLSEGESYLSYGKSYLSIMAAEELLGKAAINRVLRSMVHDFGHQVESRATVLDFLERLSAEGTRVEQQLLDDWFKGRYTYDLRIKQATVEPLPDGNYRIRGQLQANRLEWDAHGNARVAVLKEPITIGVFQRHPREMKAGDQPLYHQRHRLTSGENDFEIIVEELPQYVVVDPLGTRPEKKRLDNVWDLD